MPDFERIIRVLEKDAARSDAERQTIEAYHAGQDNARWQIVGIAAAVLAIPALVVAIAYAFCFVCNHGPQCTLALMAAIFAFGAWLSLRW